MSVKEYLDLYESSWLQLHQIGPRVGTYEYRSLYSAWRVSLDHIQEQNELSAKLLRLWCYFSNQDLWFELLCAGSSECLAWIEDLTSSLFVFSEAMRLLCNCGLVDSEKLSEDNVESRGYSIHNCGHSWTVQVLNSQWDYGLARFVVDAVARHIPDANSANLWKTQRRILQHAERCSQHIKRDNVSEDWMEWALHGLGNLFENQDKLAEAEAMHQGALRGREKVSGPEHSLTLDTINNLGNLYANQEKLAKAEAMYQRALRGKEKVWGPEDTSMLQTVKT